MVRAHPEHTFIFLFDRAYDPQFVFAPNIIPVVLSPQARAAPLYWIWFEMMVPRAIKKYRADLFLSMDNFTSMGLNVPDLLVIHDLAYLHYPEHIDALNYWYYRRYMPRFTRSASAIATVSTYSKQDILNNYKIDPAKIKVCHLGLNEGIQVVHDESLLHEYLFKNGIQSPYFLYVGTFQPRKNVASLIRAYDHFRTHNHSTTMLVLTGDKGWKNEAMQAALAASKYRDDIKVLGYQDTFSLSILLSGARALCLVSFFEGFGLPIIEAQKCGCPVITSDVSSMPEAAGGAALLVSPKNIEDISMALFKMDHNDSLRQELIQKGYKNAAHYSWEMTANILWEMIQKLTRR